MTTQQSQNWRDVVQALGPVLAILGILWAGAQAFQRLQDHDRRIVQLEQTDKEAKTLDRSNAERLARIEANLDYLVRERMGRDQNAK